MITSLPRLLLLTLLSFFIAHNTSTQAMVPATADARNAIKQVMAALNAGHTATVLRMIKTQPEVFFTICNDHKKMTIMQIIILHFGFIYVPPLIEAAQKLGIRLSSIVDHENNGLLHYAFANHTRLHRGFDAHKMARALVEAGVINHKNTRGLSAQDFLQLMLKARETNLSTETQQDISAAIHEIINKPTSNSPFSPVSANGVSTNNTPLTPESKVLTPRPPEQAKNNPFYRVDFK